MKNAFRPFAGFWLYCCLAFSLRAASPTIVFNEIMYHPPGTNDLDQWFELYSRGTKPADISGWRISRGVEFTFGTGALIPAGGYLVVAADGPTFHARYPGVNNYVAGWSGNLGHHLELSDASGKVIN